VAETIVFTYSTALRLPRSSTTFIHEFQYSGIRARIGTSSSCQIDHLALDAVPRRAPLVFLNQRRR